jgi:hypothetical protein
MFLASSRLLCLLLLIYVQQIELLRKLLAEYPSASLAGIAVGNEAISRGDVNQQQLLQYITQVRLPDVLHSCDLLQNHMHVHVFELLLCLQNLCRLLSVTHRIGFCCKGPYAKMCMWCFLLQVREVVRSVAQETGSQQLASVPVLTVELPAAWSPELVAAVDAVGAVIQPFFTGAIDTSKKG